MVTNCTKRLKWCYQEAFEMTITKQLLIASLKNNWSWHLEKIFWEDPYLINSSRSSSESSQLYLKAVIGICLWMCMFKNWLARQIKITGLNFFSPKNQYGKYAFLFTVYVIMTHLNYNVCFYYLIYKPLEY